MLSVCIYCKKSPPEITPSESHIFPYSLGGSESSEDIVCLTCNGRFNRDVEIPLLPSFRVFQSLHGIKGRRGRVPGVPATAKSEGHEARVSIGADGRPKSPVVRAETDAQGRRSWVVYGTDEMIQAIVEGIARKHPDVKWSQSHYEVPVEVLAEGFVPGDVLVRRLAAKVAFERFAQLRGDVIAADSEFDAVRDFILTGVEPQSCCGITADSRLLNGSLNFPVPAHAVLIVFHEADRFLGGFVMFFGLFLYWVILSRRYHALASMDDLLIEWPHIRETQRPLLRAAVASPV